MRAAGGRAVPASTAAGVQSSGVSVQRFAGPPSPQLPATRLVACRHVRLHGRPNGRIQPGCRLCRLVAADGVAGSPLRLKGQGQAVKQALQVGRPRRAAAGVDRQRQRQRPRRRKLVCRPRRGPCIDRRSMTGGSGEHACSRALLVSAPTERGRPPRRQPSRPAGATSALSTRRAMASERWGGWEKARGCQALLQHYARPVRCFKPSWN